MTNSLDTLPPELVDIIAEVLCSEPPDRISQDLFHLRLVCHGARNATHTRFARSYFRRRTLKLEEQSLQEMIELSKVPDFANSVKIIVFVCQHEESVNTSATESVSDVVAQAHTSTAVPYSGTTLKGALQCLRNITRVAFRGKAGERELMPGSDISSCNVKSAFCAVMSAFAACNMSPRQILVPAMLERGVLIPTNAGLGTGAGLLVLSGALRKLKSLGLRYLDGSGNSVFESWQLASSTIGDTLTAPRLNLSRLKKLSLDFNAAECSVKALDTFSERVNLPNLALLYICNVSSDSEALQNFITRHKQTLCKVFFTGIVTLRDEDLGLGLRRILAFILARMHLDTFSLSFPRSRSHVVRFPGIHGATVLEETGDYVEELNRIRVQARR